MPVERVDSPKPITDGQQIVAALQAAKLPIEKLHVVTAENDENKLLGRPRGYVSKIDFIDARFPDGKLNAATNNIEIFANSDHARRRSEYIDEIMRDMPIFTQYLILRKNVLIRLDQAVAPAAAKEYEAVLVKVVG